MLSPDLLNFIHIMHTKHAEPIQCPELTIENGAVAFTPDSRSLNSKATYSCIGGYRLSGENERFCQSDSMWSGTDPVCGKFLIRL